MRELVQALTSLFLHTKLVCTGILFRELPSYTLVPTVTITMIEVAPVTKCVYTEWQAHSDSHLT